jgi:hypothetical protein
MLNLDYNPIPKSSEHTLSPGISLTISLNPLKLFLIRLPRPELTSSDWILIHVLEANLLPVCNSPGLNLVIEAGIKCLVLLHTCPNRFPASL